MPRLTQKEIKIMWDACDTLIKAKKELKQYQEKCDGCGQFPAECNQCGCGDAVVVLKTRVKYLMKGKIQ